MSSVFICWYIYAKAKRGQHFSKAKRGNERKPLSARCLSRFSRQFVVNRSMRSRVLSRDWRTTPLTLVMNKKNFLQITILLVLATVYVVYFTDWFRPGTIHVAYIYRQVRPGRAARATRNTPNAKTVQAPPAVPQLVFGLGQNYLLTDIKVVPLAALQTNKFAPPVWHLVSNSNSVPLRRFTYGQGIRGMRPAIAGSRPERVQPGVSYRLFVTATKGRGQEDFAIGVAPSATANSQ
jgi:hypothetical protein